MSTVFFFLSLIDRLQRRPTSTFSLTHSLTPPPLLQKKHNKQPKQKKRSLRMYNSLVERCFKDCVDSFRRKDMEPAEEKVKRIFFGFFLSHFSSSLVKSFHSRFFLLFFSGFYFSPPTSLRSQKTKPRKQKKRQKTVRHQVLRKVHEAQREDGREVRGAVVAGGAADSAGDEKVIGFFLLFLCRLSSLPGPFFLSLPFFCNQTSVPPVPCGERQRETERQWQGENRKHLSFFFLLQLTRAPRSSP